MKPLSILVADDEDSIRSLVKHLLTSSGHLVTVAGNAKEACACMSEREYDLIITDVLMPDGDGIDLITEVKRVQPSARILAMSGGGRYLEGGDYLKLASGLGAHSALMKPFTFQQLQSAIERALGATAEPGKGGESAP